MSDPTTPAVRARPSTVTISSYLLFLVALLYVVNAVAGLSTIGAMADAMKEAFAGTGVSGVENVVVAFGVVTGVIQLLLAAAFVVLGLLNNQGRNGSRITTWVVAGISMCCSTVALGGSGTDTFGSQPTTGNAPDPAEIERRIAEATPSWLEPLSITTSVIAVIALVAVIVLLALPPSNEFFRKRQPVGEPPMPGGTYPAYPQYPGSTPAPGGEGPSGPPPSGPPPSGPPPSAG